MSNATVTDADIRIQIERYLDAGGCRADFDVEKILDDTMEIIREHGHESLDDVHPEVFARIVRRHDISLTAAAAVEQQQTADRSPTETLIRDLYATIEFFTAHPELPVPWAVTLNARVDTLQQVEAIAEQFERREYGSHDSDGTPQTDFDIPGVEGRINVIVSAPKPKRSR